MFAFAIFPSTPRKQVWQLYPVFFCSETKHGEKLQTVSFSLVFPQNVPLEMMNANLTTLPISFEVAIKFYIKCGNDKKICFSPKSSTFQHCSTGHLKAVYHPAKRFLPKFRNKSLLKRVFKKLFSSKNSSGRIKSFLTGLPKPLLPKVILGYCSKSGIDKKSLIFP